MSDHSASHEALEQERRIAHSGALARWARYFARHPWRVIFSWIARSSSC